MEKCLSKLVWHLEDPRVGQSYPNYYVDKLASKFVKVVLAGTGGDDVHDDADRLHRLPQLESAPTSLALIAGADALDGNPHTAMHLPSQQANRNNVIIKLSGHMGCRTKTASLYSR